MSVEKEPMKKTLQAILVPFFLLAFLGNWVFAQETKGPKIVIKELVHDFKDVKEGEVIEHTFRVFNEGDETLKITKVKPG